MTTISNFFKQDPLYASTAYLFVDLPNNQRIHHWPKTNKYGVAQSGRMVDLTEQEAQEIWARQQEETK